MHTSEPGWKGGVQQYFLQDAIFGAKYTGYFVWRMRFFLPVALITLLISGVELYLVEQVFSATVIVQVVLMRLIAGLALGGWWGCLEVMREFIRGRHAFSDRAAIEQSIPHWMVLGLVVAAATVAAPMGFFYSQNLLLLPEDRLVYDLYLVGFAINIFFELGIEAYRSGAFAIRRVYRPLYAIIGPGIFTLLLFFILWKYMGGLGLPIAFLLGQCIDAAVRIWYIRKTYHLLRLNPHRLPSLREFWKFLARFPGVNAIMAWLAGLCINIESVLIIIYFTTLDKDPRLIVYLFILKHIYHAYSYWGVMFFYYDFRKMSTMAYPPFYKTFLKKLFPFTFIISGIFFLFTIPATYIFYKEQLFLLLPITGIFSLLISVFSYIVLHAFSLNRYIDLIAGALLSVGVFMWGVEIYNSLLMNSVSLLVSLVILVLFLLKPHFPAMGTIESVKKQSLYTLMTNLKKIKGGYYITKLKTNPKAGGKALTAFLGRLALLMDQRGWICPVKSNVFFLIETLNHQRLPAASLAKMEGVKSSMTMTLMDKEACLEYIHQEIAKNIADNPFFKSGISWDNDKIARLRPLFHREFPEGKILELIHSSALFNDPDKMQIYASIEEFYHVPLSMVRKSPWLGSLLFDAVPTLFLIDKSKYKFRKLSHWSEFVHFLNFQKLKNIKYKILF